MSQMVYDVRFSAEDLYHRFCKILQIMLFVSLTDVCYRVAMLNPRSTDIHRSGERWLVADKDQAE